MLRSFSSMTLLNGIGTRVAINGEPHRLTYGELAALASRVGNGLLELGVSRRGPHPNRASGFG